MDFQEPEIIKDNLFGFFERLKTMSSIKRFGTLPMIEIESVASHSYNVAIMALMMVHAFLIV